MLSISSIDLYRPPYVPRPAMPLPRFGCIRLEGFRVLFIENGRRKEVHVEERIMNKRAKWHVFYRRRGAAFSMHDYRPSYETYADAAAREVAAYLRLHNPRSAFEIVSAMRTDPQSIL